MSSWQPQLQQTVCIQATWVMPPYERICGLVWGASGRELEAALLHTFLSVSSFCIGAAVVTRSEPLGISSTVALNWATYRKETAKTVRRVLQ
jgi:hypothetical protein